MALTTCPECTKEVSDRAASCPNCGAPISVTAAQDPPATTHGNPRNQPDGHVDVRAGMNQAKFSEEGSQFLIFQVLVVAIGAGVALQSWWWFGGALLGLMVLLSIPGVRSVLAGALALGAGYATYVGAGFFELDSGFKWVATILVSMAFLGANMAGLDWVKDIQRAEKAS